MSIRYRNRPFLHTLGNTHSRGFVHAWTAIQKPFWLRLKKHFQHSTGSMKPASIKDSTQFLSFGLNGNSKVAAVQDGKTVQLASYFNQWAYFHFFCPSKWQTSWPLFPQMVNQLGYPTNRYFTNCNLSYIIILLMK